MKGRKTSRAPAVVAFLVTIAALLLITGVTASGDEAPGRWEPDTAAAQPSAAPGSIQPSLATPFSATDPVPANRPSGTAALSAKANEPAASKMQPALSGLAALSGAGDHQAAADFAAAQGLRLKDGRVQVVVEAAVEPQAVAAALDAAGAVTETAHGGLIQATVPPGQLSALASDPAVKYVRRPAEPVTFTTSEGVADIGATAWRSAGQNGNGVKVAVLDPGFSGYTQRVSAGELPAGVITRSFVAGGDITGGGEVHGTACAEIVYDVAPGAQLYLVNFSTDVELANAIDYIIAEGIDVVSASWGFYGSFRGDGQGSVNDLVQQANAAGILWANAAGNAAQTHWSGSFTDTNADSWHEFATGDTGNDVTVSSGTRVDVYLTWNRWPATDQDYDMYLVYEGQSGSTVAAGDAWQSGTQEPAEEIHYTVPPGKSGRYWIVIKNYSAAGDATFNLYTHPSSLQYQVAAGSLGGQPTDSPYAMTVGAVPAGSTSIESFSSRGPTVDGRIKPDIVGPDRVSTATYGTTGFWGTSAAAPHAAGAAALVKGAHSSYAPAATQGYLESRATGLGAPGKDNTFGSGKLNLGPLPDLLAPQVTSVQPSGSISGTGATIAIDYTDTGSGVDTSSVSVTLDGNVLSGCSVTVSHAECAVTGLAPGPHSIGGSVSDNEGNTAPISGSFEIVGCTKPNLALSAPAPFWASYADYVAHELSVNWSLCDAGLTGAYGIQLEGTVNTSSVVGISPFPMSLGDIPAGTGGCQSYVLRYSLPPGVASFKSITYATASDYCGTAYSYPSAFPGA